ncbi:GNAT family N-acetyltransferase [Streptococcus oricebi]|uniref:GNAT family N-acetyltransferase n=1 Tax=Streptococcus oricebi TaxID=1547447 RepID=UPI003B848838
MKIRFASPRDLEEIILIEQENFSVEEAASPQAMKERLEKIADTFLVAEFSDQIVGYIVGPVIEARHLTDDLFEEVVENPETAGFIAVQSLSVRADYKGQGLGTLLLAALKELAVKNERQGISLTCHDYLISYYEMNGFVNEGLSQSLHGGATWYDLVWDNPYLSEEEK